MFTCENIFGTQLSHDRHTRTSWSSPTPKEGCEQVGASLPAVRRLRNLLQYVRVEPAATIMQYPLSQD